MPSAPTLDEYIAAALALREQLGGDVKVMTWRVNGGVQAASLPTVAYTKYHVASVKGVTKVLAKAGVFYDDRYDLEEQRGERVVRIK